MYVFFNKRTHTYYNMFYGVFLAPDLIIDKNEKIDEKKLILLYFNFILLEIF